MSPNEVTLCDSERKDEHPGACWLKKAHSRESLAFLHTVHSQKRAIVLHTMHSAVLMWDNGSLLVSTQSSPSLSFDQTGEREVELKVHHLCTANTLVFHWSPTTVWHPITMSTPCDIRDKVNSLLRLAVPEEVV